MADLIRESAMGQLVRFITRNQWLQYPEERDDFNLPAAYQNLMKNEKIEAPNASEESSPPASLSPNDKAVDKTNPETRDDADTPRLSLARTKTRLETEPFTEERLEVERQLAIERTMSRPVIPQKTTDGLILVDWYTTDDPANPQNWSNGKRAFVASIICLYTFAVYTGSAIYTSGEQQVIDYFGITPLDASLPLSLYVLAYGMGPLLFSPLSEIPAIGRNPVYVITFLIFVILSIPTALVQNFAGLLVLRFLQGFFGSPCLATGAATMQDIYSLLRLPYALMFWVTASYCGPALGPLLSGFAVMAENWRWSLWEILWAAGPIFVLMFLCLPETSSPNILLRRARRLRKLTGNDQLRAQSEIDQYNIKPMDAAWDALIKPFEISIKDPAIMFVNVYVAIIYGIYYSFFEVFPLVFIDIYHFNIGTLGVLFLCVLIACLLAVAIYAAYLHWYLIPDIMKRGLRAQEHRLVPALIASFGPPIGLFIFGWTANEHIHWIVPTIGITIYAASVFIVAQCIFVYVPLSYPMYAASLFAANDFLRSSFACGSILFARPLFLNLGIGKGVSILGGLSWIGVIGVFVLYFIGDALRARSKFTQK